MNKENKRRILDAQARRGEEAQRLLDNVLLQETFGAMERDILATMKRLKPNDEEGRDVCWRELRALERFKGKFRSYVATGENAQKGLLQLLKSKF